MNLFVTHHCPDASARDHCDKHCTKMLLESAQLLSTAHHLEGDPADVPGIYKPTHRQHPSAVWVRETSSNYTWAYDLFVALCREYSVRYGRVHLTETKLRDALMTMPRHITRAELTPPPACMPQEFKLPEEEGDWPIQSYRQYLARGKDWLTVDSFQKRGGGAPTWFRLLAEEVPA